MVQQAIANKAGMDVSTITDSHYRVHDGILFNISHVFTNTADSATAEIYIMVGANNLHLAGNVAKIGAGQVDLIRSASATANGSTITAFNRNQNKADSGLDTEFLYTPTAPTGTVINGTYLAGSAGKNQPITANARTSAEWELKPNTNYIIRIHNLAGTATSIGVTLDVYET